MKWGSTKHDNIPNFLRVYQNMKDLNKSGTCFLVSTILIRHIGANHAHRTHFPTSKVAWLWNYYHATNKIMGPLTPIHTPLATHIDETKHNFPPGNLNLGYAMLTPLPKVIHLLHNKWLFSKYGA